MYFWLSSCYHDFKIYPLGCNEFKNEMCLSTIKHSVTVWTVRDISSFPNPKFFQEAYIFHNHNR